MTVEVQTSKNGPYELDAGALVFPRTFLLLNASHLRVIHTVDGVDRDVTSGFTHTGIGANEGSVVFTAGTVPKGGVLTLLRNVPISQETDYSDQAAVRPRQVERDFDKAIMLIQDLKEQVDRSVKVPVSATDDIEQLTEELAAGINALAPVAPQIGALGPVADSIAELAPVAGEVATVAQNIDVLAQANGSVISRTAATYVVSDEDGGIYTLPSRALSEENVLLWLNGVRQIPHTDYTVAGDQLTLLAERDQGDLIDVLVDRIVSAENLIEKIEQVDQALLNSSQIFPTRASWLAARSDDGALIEGWVAGSAVETTRYIIYVMRSETGIFTKPDGSRWNPIEPRLEHWGPMTQANITAMTNYCGYVRICSRNVVTEIFRIDAPSIFDVGAYVENNTTIIPFFKDRIISPPQFIFRGTGRFEFTSSNAINGNGENSRQGQLAWFGITPGWNRHIPDYDCGALITKAFSMYGNGRESTLIAEVGNYIMRSTAWMTRGAGIMGPHAQGQRRTVFKRMTDGYPLFADLNDACFLERVQFEPDHNSPVKFQSEFVNFTYNGGRIRNVNVGGTGKGIVVSGTNIEICDIGTAYGEYFGDGSSVVDVHGGSHIWISNVFSATSTSGTQYMVRIASINSGVGAVFINNVSTISGAIPVMMEAINGNINRVMITNVMNNGWINRLPACVYIKAGGGNVVNGVFIDGMMVTGMTTDCLRIDVSGGSSVSAIQMDGVIAQNYASGYIVRSQITGSGTIEPINIGQFTSERRLSVGPAKVRSFFRVIDTHEVILGEGENSRYRLRTISGSGHDLSIEKTSDDGTTWAQIAKYENSSTEHGWHFNTNLYSDNFTRLQQGGNDALRTHATHGGLLFIRSSYANDTAAKAAGVPQYAIYHQTGVGLKRQELA